MTFVFTDIDKLITINGLVIRTSSLVPEMREAFFECHVCHKTMSVEIERGRIAEPILCQNCNTNHSYQLIHNRSHFSDKQMVKLQESPGMTHESFELNTTHYLCNIMFYCQLASLVHESRQASVMLSIYAAYQCHSCWLLL